MSVLVYLESWEGNFKKNTWESAFYAAKTAEMLGTEAIGLCIGNLNEDPSVAGQYGISKVLHLEDAAFNSFDANSYGAAIAEVAASQGADTIILSGTFNGKALAPALSINADAALLTNVVALPESSSPFSVKRGVYSSKGFNILSSDASKRVVVFVPNSLALEAGEGSAAVESVNAGAGDTKAVEVTEVDRVKGKIPLPEAERVVSGGRGLKGPENWGMIEELAEVLDAGTACSKPVSDMDWRPHSEHVGQTGIAIKPNLYVAVGISGAIQHLAGVSASNTIVVINKDAEAPFFKAADYGIVGDAFEVVPKLTAALKEFKANN
jgi:electron transfer flavoprotein alpha subunit